MRVFVLSTGRAGSHTFAAACAHLTNYRTAHESRHGIAGLERVEFPNWRIEVDNRLAWHLGELARRYDGTSVLYVHLRRDPEAVARSFLNRWDSPYRASMIRAYAHGILQQRDDWPEGEREAVCRAYIETVTANIEMFTAGRPSMTIWLEEAQGQFPGFLDRIGAEGDLDAAVAEWQVVHSPTRTRARTTCRR